MNCPDCNGTGWTEQATVYGTVPVMCETCCGGFFKFIDHKDPADPNGISYWIVKPEADQPLVVEPNPPPMPKQIVVNPELDKDPTNPVYSPPKWHLA